VEKIAGSLLELQQRMAHLGPERAVHKYVYHANPIAGKE
jgi:hypothetical protein